MRGEKARSVPLDSKSSKREDSKMNVKGLRKFLEGVDEDRQVVVRCGDWIYAAASADHSVMTPDEHGGFENDGPRTPDDFDVVMLRVVE